MPLLNFLAALFCFMSVFLSPEDKEPNVRKTMILLLGIINMYFFLMGGNYDV